MAFIGFPGLLCQRAAARVVYLTAENRAAWTVELPRIYSAKLGAVSRLLPELLDQLDQPGPLYLSSLLDESGLPISEQGELPLSNEMPAGLAEAIAGTEVSAPSSDKLMQVQEVGRELHVLQAEIKEREAGLKEKKAQAQGIIHRTLPDLLAELHLDRLGMSDVDADMVLRPYYKAGISSEWDVDRQERAFAWLDENGFGSLIRHDVTYSFRRGEENRAHWLVDLVRQATAKRVGRIEEVARTEGRQVRADETWDMPEPTVRKNVHHSTLTSLVREQSELPADDPARKEIPLELLGAVVGRIVEIKPRGKK